MDQGAMKGESAIIGHCCNSNKRAKCEIAQIVKRAHSQRDTEYFAKGGKMRKTLISIVALILPFAVLNGSALASWPSDTPIEVAVGFAPGGPTDVMARVLLPFVAKHLGSKASFVILNKPGASGEIAVSHVSRAKPDGYTIGIVNLPGFYFLPIQRKTSYSIKDLTLVARVVSDPTIIITRKDSRFESLNQLVELLRVSPESVTAGNNGVGTNGRLAILQLEQAARVKLNSVPFTGSSHQKTAIAGGQLDVAFLTGSEIPDPEGEAKPVRILAQFSKTKVDRLKSVPTTFELGFPIEMTAERGFAVPNGTPEGIRNRLQSAIESAMKDPEYIAAALNDGPFLAFLGGEEWMRKVEQDAKVYENDASMNSK
jgi:tripartite-type tricarboxylate transporter receptor subunit TctC